ncbi:MAG: universal stress protein [Mycoplasmatales bacterium]
MYKTILVAIDINETNAEIIKKAVQFAKHNNADLIIAHVNQVTIADATFESGMSTVFTSDDENLVNEMLNKFKSLAEQSGIKNVSILIDSSTNVGYTITHDFYELEKYDLIVCGNSQRHGLEKLFLGSTAKSITKDAKSDVYIVKTKES